MTELIYRSLWMKRLATLRYAVTENPLSLAAYLLFFAFLILLFPVFIYTINRSYYFVKL